MLWKKKRDVIIHSAYFIYTVKRHVSSFLFSKRIENGQLVIVQKNRLNVEVVHDQASLGFHFQTTLQSGHPRNTSMITMVTFYFFAIKKNVSTSLRHLFSPRFPLFFLNSLNQNFTNKHHMIPISFNTGR